MDDDASSNLAVGFLIEADYAVLQKIQEVMGSTEMKVLRDAQSIEAATKGMISPSATLQISAFGAAATKELRTVARETAAAEKAGERLSSQLEREAAAFGLTRDQMRAAKVETAALAAETAGLTELAGRLRDQQQDISSKQQSAAAARSAETAAVREAAAAYQQFEAYAKLKSAEHRDREALDAAAAKEKEAQAVREAAEAYRLFEAVAKQKSTAYRDNEALAAAVAKDKEAQAVRDAAEAYRMFEAVVKQKSGEYRQREAEAAAAALRAEADATARLAREHDQLAALVRGSQAALESDAAAAERMRQATDPLYAATVRLNAEIAESTRLYHSGATAPAEYARQQQVLTDRLRVTEQQFGMFNKGMGTAGVTGQLAGHHLTNLAFQFQDIGIQMFAAAQSSQPFKMAMMAMFQQGAQIQGIMMQAGASIKDVGAAFLGMSKSILLAAATNPYLVAGAIAISAFAGAVKLLQNSANASADMTAYAKSLGLTEKQIRNLDNVTVTFGDTAKAVFQVAGRAIWDNIGPAVTDVWNVMKDWAGWIFSGVKDAANFIIGSMVGAYNTVKKTWSLLPAALGDAFYSAVNIAIDGINLLIKKSVEGLNFLSEQANKILPEAFKIPALDTPQIDKVAHQYAGALQKVGDTAREEIGKAIGKDYLGDIASSVGGAIREQAALNAQNRIRGQAEDKGYLDPKADKADKHGERLARDAAAVEAEIRNLYKLAEAYKISGAAALIAEARVKAESEAIKKRGDIEAMVNREIRLAIANRVTDAAKSTAALRDQAAAQEQVNKLVAAGNITAERAADLVKDQMADLPLLAALEAAQQRGLTDEVVKATGALADQRRERERLRGADLVAVDLQRSAAMRQEITDIQAVVQANRDLSAARQAILATGRGGFADDQALAFANAASEKALILTRANTEAEKARKDGLLSTADAILAKAKAEVAAVDTNLGLQTAEEAINRLKYAADGLDFTSAFGRGGDAVRGMIDAMDDLRDAQEAHRALVQEAGGDATKIARADALYQGAKVAGTMKTISAAKSLFKENSAGYKAMAAAEKAYAMVQMANTAVNVAAGAAKMFSSLGPWAFPVVGAMVAVMAGLGFRGGKGSASAPPVSAEELQAKFGTGTVFGNSGAQSESLSKALDILSANSNSDLEYSNQMLRTLRSIDGGIGQLAGKLGAQIGLGAAGMFDTSKLKIGSSGSSGVLGMFASSTSRSLYDQGLQIYAQNIDGILAGAFNARVYNVVQQVTKKSGFFGIGGGTSTSYSTTYNAINADIRTAFADIIGSVSDGVVGVMGQYDMQLAQNLRTAILAFKLPAIKFSTAGMNGEEIEGALQAYFSSVADQLSGLAAKQLPVLNELTKNGEGMFETLARVIKTFGGVNIGLSSIGMGGFGSSQAGLRNAAQLTDMFGDLDGFQEATSKYADKFLTEAERMAPIAAAVREEMARLGMAGVATNDQFKAMVSGLNLSTDAGRETFAALMAVAPAFAKVTDYLGDLNNTLGESAEIAKKRRDLEIQIMELQGRSAEALAARREKELLALEETLRPLQLYIYALQDEATAKAQLKTAYERESQDILKLRDKFADLGQSMREYRDSLLPQVSGGDAYARAMADFQTASGAAKLGDADAMAKLSGMGQNLLTLSSENARSQIDYLRAMAMVKQGLDGAIFAADEAVDYQQAQLDALENIVANHIDLNDNIMRVADAIEAIEAAQSGIVAIGASMGPIPIINAVTNITNDNAALREEMAELTSTMDRVAAFTERTAAATEKSNRDGWQRIVENDAVRVKEAD